MADERYIVDFSTNIGQLIAELQAGMGRVDQILKRPRGETDMAQFDLAGLRKYQDEIKRVTQEMRQLKAAQPDMTPAQFKRETAHRLTGAYENVRATLPLSAQYSFPKEALTQVTRDIARSVGTVNQPGTPGQAAGEVFDQAQKRLDQMFKKALGKPPKDSDGFVTGPPPGEVKIASDVRASESALRKAQSKDPISTPEGFTRLTQSTDLFVDGLNRIVRRTDNGFTELRASSTKLKEAQEMLAIQRRKEAGEINGGAIYKPGTRGALYESITTPGDLVTNKGVPATGQIATVAEAKKAQAKLQQDESDKAEAARTNEIKRQTAQANAAAQRQAKLAKDREAAEAIDLKARVESRKSAIPLSNGGWGDKSTGEVFAKYGQGLRRLVNSGEELDKAQRELAIRMKDPRFKHLSDNVFQDSRTERLYTSNGVALPPRVQGEKTLGQAAAGGFFGRGIGGGATPENPREALNNLAASAGTTARYALLYSTLGLLQGAFRDTVKEIADMSDSLRDVDLALGSSGTASQSFINTLSNISAFAGSNVGEALDTAAAGIRAFTQATDSLDTKQAVGTLFADSVSRLALLTNTDLKDARGNILATANAFGGAASGFDQFNDVVTTVQAKVGGNTKEISQGLSSLAGAGREAGFSMAELGAAVGLAQARTDQSGATIATRLSRVLSILGGTTGRSIIDKINSQLTEGLQIDPTASVRDQFESIARAYGTAAPELQGLIRSALGGTNNVRELLPILNNPDKVFGFKLEKGDQGRGFVQADKLSQSLSGNLRQITGQFTTLQTNLGQTDLFDGFGIGVALVEKLLSGLNKVLELFNELKSNVPFGNYIVGATALLVQLRFLAKAWAAIGGLASLKGITSTAKEAAKAGATKAGAVLPAAAAAAGGVGNLEGDLGKSRAAATASVAEAETATARGVGAAGASLVSALRLVAVEIATTGKITGAAKLGEATVGLGAASAASAAATAAAAAKGAGGVAGRAAGGLLAGSSGLLAGLLNPWVLGIGATIAGASIFYNQREYGKQVKEGTKQLSGQTQGRSATEAADAIQSAARNLDAKQKGISATLASDSRKLYLEEAKQIEGIYRKIQDRIDSDVAIARRDPQANLSQNVVLTGGTDALTASIQAMSDSGASAGVQIKALGDALDGLNAVSAPNASKQLGSLQKEIQTQFDQTGDALTTLLSGVDLSGDSIAYPGKSSRKPPAPGSAGARQEAEARAVPAKDRSAENRKYVLEQLEKNKVLIQEGLNVDAEQFARDVTPGTTIAQMKTIAQRQATSMAQSIAPDLDPTAQSELSKVFQTYFELVYSKYIKGAKEMIDGATATAVGALIQSTTGAKGQSTDSVDTPALYQEEIRQLEQVIAATKPGDDTSLNVARLAEAKKKFVESKVADLTLLLKVAAEDGDRPGAQAIYNKIFTAAVSSGNVDVILGALSLANAAEIRIARKALDDLTETLRLKKVQDAASARAAVAVRAAVLAADELINYNSRSQSRSYTAAGAAAVKANATAGSSKKAYKEALNNQKKLDEALARANDSKSFMDQGAKSAKDTAKSDADKAKADAEKAKADALALAQAKNDAAAAKVGGSVAAARAALANANLALNAAKSDSIEYYQALKQYYDARRTLSDAIANQTSLRRQLAADTTDPLVVAKIELKAAKEKLALDRRRGQAEDVLLQDQLNLRKARQTKEQTAFDQRMRDHQTAEQLGKLSHAGYIRYLQSEHARFAAIKHRTRQQQDDLNQVDLALKAAKDALSGQFNIGGIKLPTPYEVRRVVQARAAASNYQGGFGAAVNPNARSTQLSLSAAAAPVAATNIYVNGADTGEVRSILSTYLGPTASQTSGAAPRKN